MMGPYRKEYHRPADEWRVYGAEDDLLGTVQTEGIADALIAALAAEKPKLEVDLLTDRLEVDVLTTRHGTPVGGSAKAIIEANEYGIRLILSTNKEGIDADLYIERCEGHWMVLTTAASEVGEDPAGAVYLADDSRVVIESEERNGFEELGDTLTRCNTCCAVLPVGHQCREE